MRNVKRKREKGKSRIQREDINFYRSRYWKKIPMMDEKLAQM